MIVSPNAVNLIGPCLNSGQDVTLEAGETYVLTEPIWLTEDRVTLDGNGATLVLDTSFSNKKYAPHEIHGDVHTAPGPMLVKAIGIYVQADDVTVKNLKIVRQTVDGSVVRSVAVAYSHDFTLQNCEFAGDTIGPVIEFIRCDNFLVAECKIHSVNAVNLGGTLDLTGAGKPNLTGILVDDVDLLSESQRMDESYHSLGFRIVNNQIADLTMHPSVPAGSPWHAQVDGINVQRGYQFTIQNNVIVNCDEGIDIMGSRGQIVGNVIKDTSPVAGASAGIKFVHGASYNLCLENTFINRDICVMLEHSPGYNLTATGVQHNAITLNKATGSGAKLFRVSTGPGYNPAFNTVLYNAGGVTRSDYALVNEPNFLLGGGVVKVADFSGNRRRDVMFLFPDGRSKIYNCFSQVPPWQITPNYGEINNMANPDDVLVYDWDGDGLPDVLFQLGSDTRRLYLNQGNGLPFRFVGTVSY